MTTPLACPHDVLRGLLGLLGLLGNHCAGVHAARHGCILPHADTPHGVCLGACAGLVCLGVRRGCGRGGVGFVGCVCGDRFPGGLELGADGAIHLRASMRLGVPEGGHTRYII